MVGPDTVEWRSTLVCTQVVEKVTLQLVFSTGKSEEDEHRQVPDFSWPCGWWIFLDRWMSVIYECILCMFNVSLSCESLR